LCETKIGLDGLEIIRNKYTCEKDSKTASLNLLRTEINEKSTKLKEAQEKVQVLETNINKNRALLQGDVSILVQAISVAKESTDKLEEKIVFLYFLFVEF